MASSEANTTGTALCKQQGGSRVGNALLIGIAGYVYELLRCYRLSTTTYYQMDPTIVCSTIKQNLNILFPTLVNFHNEQFLQQFFFLKTVQLKREISVLNKLYRFIINLLNNLCDNARIDFYGYCPLPMSRSVISFIYLPL